MKASHLVMILEHIIDEHGDLTVMLEDSEMESMTLYTVALYHGIYSNSPGPITLNASDLPELRHSDTDLVRWRIHDMTNDIIVSRRPDPPPEAPYVAWVP